MNRLIIIGNGFDLAHGLKTSFNDFISDYFCNAINSFFTNGSYSDILLEINFKVDNHSFNKRRGFCAKFKVSIKKVSV
jgi:hypothetical protein